MSLCMVTGATRGLGEAAAVEMARRGFDVVIVGRDPNRVEATLAKIRDIAKEAQVEGLLADLSSQQDICRLADEFQQRHSALDVLINNVGVTLLSYQASPEGLEMTWSLNYLNHFFLTNLLLDPLQRAAREHGEARIVEVTSSFFRFARADFRRRQGQKRYNGVLAYAQSKRAMMVFTCEMARRLKGSGITINAVTPGLVRTNVADGNGWLAEAILTVMDRFAQPVEKGVLPIVELASSNAYRGVSGGYFQKFRPGKLSRAITDPLVGQLLWKISEGETQ
jgi:retinol dehydrogenase 12